MIKKINYVIYITNNTWKCTGTVYCKAIARLLPPPRPAYIWQNAMISKTDTKQKSAWEKGGTAPCTHTEYFRKPKLENLAT